MQNPEFSQIDLKAIHALLDELQRKLDQLRGHL